MEREKGEKRASTCNAWNHGNCTIQDTSTFITSTLMLDLNRATVLTPKPYMYSSYVGDLSKVI